MLNKLLQSLRERPSSSVVFNQYRDENVLNNLKMYLHYLLKHNNDILFVGEAPGYRGCRLTGIPFTSGAVIRTARHDIFKQIGDQIKLAHVDAEATASVVWEYFDTNRPIPILWNSFPFHPHAEGDQDSNRKPYRAEIEEGKHYLLMLCQIFKPKKLCSLGRVGHDVLSEIFPDNDVIYVRHPARGGKHRFLDGMKTMY